MPASLRVGWQDVIVGPCLGRALKNVVLRPAADCVKLGGGDELPI